LSWGLFIILGLFFFGRGAPSYSVILEDGMFYKRSECFGYNLVQCGQFRARDNMPHERRESVNRFYTLMGYASLTHPTWYF